MEAPVHVLCECQQMIIYYFFFSFSFWFHSFLKKYFFWSFYCFTGCFQITRLQVNIWGVLVMIELICSVS